MKNILLCLLALAFSSAGLHAQNAFITTWKTTTANESITIPINPKVSGYNYTVDWGDGNTSTNQTGDATHTYATAGTHTVSITGSFPAIQFGGGTISSSDIANAAKLIAVTQWGSQVWQSMVGAFRGCSNLTGVSTTDNPKFIDGISLASMFYGATSFNQDLNSWDVSEVQDMSAMFHGDTSFNGDISGWQTGNVTIMSSMFFGASAFNQDIGSWDVSNVVYMSSMFSGASVFNQDIGSWDVSNVISMFAMFSYASAFNQDIGNWDVSKVIIMSYMFQNTSFNQDIGNWDVSDVTSMYAMFLSASAFNQNISGWNVSKVTDMRGMFDLAKAFNQDIGNWDVSNVTNMKWMFEGASSFNQDIGHWDVSNVTHMEYSLDSSGVSTANYDSTLIGWAAQNVQANITLGAHGLTYCAGDSARQALIDNHGWTINGDSKDPNCTVSNPDAFITTWETTTANESITIPINAGVSGYNYTVDWGDGTASANQTASATHQYAAAGTHTVSITGDFPAIDFGNDGASDAANDAKLLTIKQWGSQVWQGMTAAFHGCVNLTTESGTDSPVFAANSTLANMFDGCTSFNSDLNDWDVSEVIDMNGMFTDATSFDGHIGQWDVSGVTDMDAMFSDDSAFNQDISGWDVSKVTDMGGMFANAYVFNQDIGNWNVSGVTNMQSMFLGASAFNQDIGGWNVSKVTTMGAMFAGASTFNQDISRWDVSGVTNMLGMFTGASAFNQDIGGWNMLKVTDMSTMFYLASAFNQDIGQWDVSNVTHMEHMLDSSGLSTAHYDSTLIGWAAQQNIPSGLILGAAGLTYCAGDSARQALIDNHGWTINGDKMQCGVTARPDANGILYVDSAIATPGDGSSWAKALKYLSDATQAANEDSLTLKINEIHVARGTYYPTGVQSGTNRDSTFALLRGG